MDWQAVEDELEDMMRDLPQVSPSQMASLRSTGQLLGGFLQETDWQREELIERSIVERYDGAAWPEDLSPLVLLCLRMRFDWAFAVLDGIRHCGLPKPRAGLALRLLVASWDHGGFEHSHAGFLQTYYRGLLDDNLPLVPIDPGS